ncbi:MAG: thioredoxin domain-containing protein [Pseudomonadota bacterium]
MKQMKFAVAALALAAGSTAVWAAPAKKVPAADWSRTVVATPEGGFAMGNPKAKVTLVEYASLACPHCRDFAAQAFGPLKNGYVKSGRVRFEYRPFILNGYDLAATTVARCAGPRGFFPIAEAAFANQNQWMARIKATPEARLKQLEGLPTEKLFPEMARIAGFQALGASKGLPAARANVCLADKAAAQRLLDQTNAGRARGVKGTPTFYLNGRQVDGNDWASVEAAIKAAL